MIKQFIFVLLLFFGLTIAARPDILVVVEINSPIPELTAREVSDIYMGRTRRVTPGIEIHPVEQNSSLRERFFKSLNGMNLYEVNTHWARLQFSGAVLPPLRVDNSRAVIDILHGNSSIIGYIDETEVNNLVRTILRIKE